MIPSSPRTRRVLTLSSVPLPVFTAVLTKLRTTSSTSSHMHFNFKPCNLTSYPPFSFPSSKWDNIRSNMGQSGSSPSTSQPSPHSTSPPSTPTTSQPSTPTGSGKCANVGAWSSGSVYTGGMSAIFRTFLLSLSDNQGRILTCS